MMSARHLVVASGCGNARSGAVTMTVSRDVACRPSHYMRIGIWMSRAPDIWMMMWIS
jgi:hypothetical protein